MLQHRCKAEALHSETQIPTQNKYLFQGAGWRIRKRQPLYKIAGATDNPMSVEKQTSRCICNMRRTFEVRRMLSLSKLIEIGPPSLAHQPNDSRFAQTIGHFLRQRPPYACCFRQIFRGKWRHKLPGKKRLPICRFFKQPPIYHFQQPALLNDPPSLAPIPLSVVSSYFFLPGQQYFEREVRIRQQLWEAHHFPEQVFHPSSLGRFTASDSTTAISHQLNNPFLLGDWIYQSYPVRASQVHELLLDRCEAAGLDFQQHTILNDVNHKPIDRYFKLVSWLCVPFLQRGVKGLFIQQTNAWHFVFRFRDRLPNILSAHSSRLARRSCFCPHSNPLLSFASKETSTLSRSPAP